MDGGSYSVGLTTVYRLLKNFRRNVHTKNTSIPFLVFAFLPENRHDKNAGKDYCKFVRYCEIVSSTYRLIFSSSSSCWECIEIIKNYSPGMFRKNTFSVTNI